MSEINQPFTTTPEAIGAALDDLSGAETQNVLAQINPDEDNFSLWMAALSDLKRSGSGYASVAFFGDSWAENNRTVNPFATLLQETYGAAGGFWV